MTTINQEVYLSPKEVARTWKLAETTLRKWRWEGKGPIFFKLGGKVLYRESDILAFVKNNMRCSTSDIGGLVNA